MWVDYKHSYFDKYDWHKNWEAGGNAVGISGFRDEWAAMLDKKGLAENYKISGYWYESLLYEYPTDWLQLPTSSSSKPKIIQKR